LELALFAGRPLGIDEQADAIFEAEIGDVGVPELVVKGRGHHQLGAGLAGLFSVIAVALIVFGTTVATAIKAGAWR
jgi:hypothetical protein